MPPKSVGRWVPDKDAKTCTKCGTSFSLFKRRHHCRECGEVFCGNCSSRKRIVPLVDKKKAVRVCEDCRYPPKPTEKPAPAPATQREAVVAAAKNVEPVCAAREAEPSPTNSTTTSAQQGSAAPEVQTPVQGTSVEEGETDVAQQDSTPLLATSDQSSPNKDDDVHGEVAQDTNTTRAVVDATDGDQDQINVAAQENATATAVREDDVNGEPNSVDVSTTEEVKDENGTKHNEILEQPSVSIDEDNSALEQQDDATLNDQGSPAEAKEVPPINSESADNNNEDTSIKATKTESSTEAVMPKSKSESFQDIADAMPSEDEILEEEERLLCAKGGWLLKPRSEKSGANFLTSSLRAFNNDWKKRFLKIEDGVILYGESAVSLKNRLPLSALTDCCGISAETMRDDGCPSYACQYGIQLTTADKVYKFAAVEHDQNHLLYNFIRRRIGLPAEKACRRDKRGSLVINPHQE